MARPGAASAGKLTTTIRTQRHEQPDVGTSGPDDPVDVLVVGGGVTGSSIAYHLARQGARVTILEQHEPAVEPSASWASAGGVRQQNRDAREWLLTLEAARRWPGLDSELGAPTGFVQGGHLHVVEDAAQRAELEEQVRRERAAGMDVRVVSGDELRDLAPGLTGRAVAAAYTPGDGQAHPPSTTRAFAAAARRHGGRYLTGVRATALCQDGGRITGVTAQDGRRYAAEQVVLAAGVWSPRLAASIGLDLPVRTRALQMLLTTPGTRQLSPTVTVAGRALSAKQLPGGEFFIGGGWPGEVVHDGERLACMVRQASIEGSLRVASEVLPAIGQQQIERAWCGLEAESVDGVPLIGRAPGWSGLLLAVGFSGHGFQIAPAVGRAVADALAGEQVVALKPLDPARLLR